MSDVGRVHFDWISHVDGDWLAQPHEVSDAVLARAMLAATKDDATVDQVHAFCRLVAIL